VPGALPALLKEGLLERADRFLSLPKGYYGLAGTLLTLAFMFLTRLRNPGVPRHGAPLHGPGGTGSAEVRLAERLIRLRDGPEVCQIRRRQTGRWDARDVFPTGTRPRLLHRCHEARRRLPLGVIRCKGMW